MILDPKAIGDGTRIGIDVGLEGSDATDQLVTADMAGLVRRWLACSLQRFASVKWIRCRLVAQCAAVGPPVE
jgi:hypothetical protein